MGVINVAVSGTTSDERFVALGPVPGGSVISQCRAFVSFSASVNWQIGWVLAGTDSEDIDAYQHGRALFERFADKTASQVGQPKHLLILLADTPYDLRYPMEVPLIGGPQWVLCRFKGAQGGTMHGLLTVRWGERFAIGVLPAATGVPVPPPNGNGGNGGQNGGGPPPRELP